MNLNLYIIHQMTQDSQFSCGFLRISVERNWSSKQISLSWNLQIKAKKGWNKVEEQLMFSLTERVPLPFDFSHLLLNFQPWLEGIHAKGFRSFWGRNFPAKSPSNIQYGLRLVAFSTYTPKKINMSLEKGPCSMEFSSSNHQYSGDMLVFGGRFCLRWSHGRKVAKVIFNKKSKRTIFFKEKLTSPSSQPFIHLHPSHHLPNAGGLKLPLLFGEAPGFDNNSEPVDVVRLDTVGGKAG